MIVSLAPEVTVMSLRRRRGGSGGDRLRVPFTFWPGLLDIGERCTFATIFFGQPVCAFFRVCFLPAVPIVILTVTYFSERVLKVPWGGILTSRTVVILFSNFKRHGGASLLKGIVVERRYWAYDISAVWVCANFGVVAQEDGTFRCL